LHGLIPEKWHPSVVVDFRKRIGATLEKKAGSIDALANISNDTTAYAWCVAYAEGVPQAILSLFPLACGFIEGLEFQEEAQKNRKRWL
jgi:hypothetical protein